MAITINGSGTITGISTGGLPDGIVDGGTLASSAVTSTKIADGTITASDISASDVKNLKSGRKNLIINGGFDVWQRGTSFTTDNVFTADRWKSGDGTGGSPARTLSRESFTVGQTDVPNEPQYYLRHNQTSVSTNGNSSVSYNIEGVRSGAGQQITFSFYAKSNTTLNYRIRLIQGFGSSGSASVTAYNTNHSVGTTWAKTTITTTLPSISGKTVAGGDDELTINLECTSTSTYTFDLAQVQLELGDTATDFEHRSYGEELALCQRYYQRWETKGSSSRFMIGAGHYNTTTQIVIPFSLYPHMRSAPSFEVSSTSTFDIEPFDVAPSSITASDFTVSGGRINVSDSASRVRGYAGSLFADTTGAYIAFDAEL